MLTRLVVVTVCLLVAACGRTQASRDDDNDEPVGDSGPPVGDVDIDDARVLDFADCAALPSGAVLRRASPATMTLAVGIAKVDADTPRCPVDPATGAATGLLLEPAATNIVGASEQWDIAALTGWFENDGGAVDLDAVAAPDGTLTAERVRDTSPSDRSRVAFGAAPADITGYWTCSLFARGDTSFVMDLGCELLGGGVIQQGSVTVDLANGVILGNSGTFLAGAWVTPAGNGWWRVAMSILANDTGNNNLILSAFPDGVTREPEDTGAIFAWGAQLERGLGATSYISTTPGGVTTRAADVLDLAGAFSGSAGGTVLVDADINAFTPGQETVLFDAVTDANAWALRLMPDTTVTRAEPSAKAYAGQEFVIAFMTQSRWQVASRHLLATTLDATGAMSIAMDGVLGPTETLNGSVGPFSGMRIGRDRNDMGIMNGHVRRIVTWPRVLTPDDLRAATAD